MVENLKRTLEIFEWCSSQKINWEKSALCGINIEDNKLSLMVARLLCKIE